MLEVEEANKDLQFRRTKSWKVTVPYSMKSLMENSELYPPGWTHRRYFEQRPTTYKRNKVTNAGSSVLEEVMQQEQPPAGGTKSLDLHL